MADIKLKSAEWNSLSSEQQERIAEILRSSNLLHEGDRITADQTPAGQPGPAGPETADESIWCEFACNAGEVAAVAACGLLTGPAAAVCIAAAHAAGELCRSKC